VQGRAMPALSQQPRRSEKVDAMQKMASALTTGLAVVLRDHPRVKALLHVVCALDDLVDVSWQWSIARACSLESGHNRSRDGGARRLVARLVARRPLDSMDPFYRAAQLSAGLVNASKRGDTGLASWLLEHLICKGVISDSNSSTISKAIEAAAAHGHLQMLDLLLSHIKRKDQCTDSAMLSAANGNQMETLAWLYERSGSLISWSSSGSPLLEAVAGNGNLEMAEWVQDKAGEDFTSLSACQAVQRAVSGGHIEMAKWLVAALPSLNRSIDLDEASGKGFLDVVQWGRESGGSCSTEAMDAAASNDHLDGVEWLHDHCTEGCTTRAMNDAAAHGHLDIVQWLHANRTEGCTTDAMDGAARHGHLDVVQWLHNNRSEGCTVAAMDGAAQENKLAVVQWLHDHRSEGCTVAASDEAASFGHVAMMQWLLTNRPESGRLSRAALANAAANGQLDAVKWLYEHHQMTGAEDGDSAESAENDESADVWIGCEAMNRAAGGGHLDVVKWLHGRCPDNGGCTTEAMDQAASNGHQEMVEWLHANRREGCTSSAMDGAAASGHFEVLLFLHSRRSEGCTSDAGINAALNEHVEIVQWLLQCYPQQINDRRVRNFAVKYNFSLLDWFHRSRIPPTCYH
ncbi:hypothetical protein BBJ28_00014360, partial [Nothophytophthora sp. Chile5]